MNTIINDRGETVAAVGNEISIARAKARWPKLIEETQTIFKNYPHDFEVQLINHIAAQNIRNAYEAQAVLDAAILPLIEKQTIKEPRITIDPAKYSAMFVPSKFNVGDPVTFTNDYGVVFENKKISGIDKNYGKETRYFMEPTETPWFSSKESNFSSLTLDLPSPAKQEAINAFAQKGIILADAKQQDYVWTHEPYLRTEDVKDLKISIHKDNYMGDIVHTELHKNVKFEDANTLSDKILTEYKQSLLIDKTTSILNSVEDAQWIIPGYVKTNSFFETVHGAGNAPDKLTISDEGKEQVYAFILASRMVLEIQHIKALETLYAHGDKGIWLRDLPPKSYELLNNISMSQLDEGKFDVNQKMLAHSLSGNITEWNDLKDRYYLVKSMTHTDNNYNGAASLCITKTGMELVNTAHVISEKLLSDYKQSLAATTGEPMLTDYSKEIGDCKNGSISTTHVVIIDTYKNNPREVPFHYSVHALNYAQELAQLQTVPGDISVKNIETNHITNSTNIDLSPYVIPSKHKIHEIQEGVAFTDDTTLLTNLSQLFPENKADQDGEVTIDLIPPNGKDFYERISIRPVQDDDNLFPSNSFHIKHFTASPATGNMTSDSQHIKHEFTFSVVDNKINPYWMQNGTIYHDLLPPQRSNSDHIKTPDEIKHDLNQFVSNMLDRTSVNMVSAENTVLGDELIKRGFVQGIKTDNVINYLSPEYGSPGSVRVEINNEINRIAILSYGPETKNDKDFFYKTSSEFQKQSSKALSLIDTLTVSKGATFMSVEDTTPTIPERHENAYDEFNSIVLNVAQYGKDVATFDKMQSQGFTLDALNKYHAEAVKLVDSAIADGFKPQSYALIQEMHTRAPEYFKIHSFVIDKIDSIKTQLRTTEQMVEHHYHQADEHYLLADKVHPDDYKGYTFHTAKAEEHIIKAEAMSGRLPEATPTLWDSKGQIITPQTYKFQINDYEESHSKTYMIGLGTIDDQNRFTGNMKLEESRRGLADKADFDVKSDCYRAWNGVNGMGDGYRGYSVLAAAIPVTNITLVQQQEQGIPPTFPALSATEAKELNDFTAAVTKNYPTASTDNLTKLCTIASDMTTLTIQNERGTLSNEKYNSLTDSQEKQVRDIISKELPGTKPLFSYDEKAPAIKLRTLDDTSSLIIIPEFPKNKLVMPQEPIKTQEQTNTKKR